MPRFKLLGGIHSEDGEKFSYNPKKTTVVESERELDVLFANKFERLEGKTKRPRDKDDSLDNSGRVMDSQEHVRQREERKKLKKRRAVADLTEEDDEMLDQPRGLNAKSKDGSRVRGEDPDDDELNDDEQEEADDEQAKEISKNRKVGKKATAKDEDEDTDSEEEEDGDEEEEEEASKFGDDVTGDFSDAESVDLKVFVTRKGGKAKFTVVDADEPTKALNPKPLTDKKAVNKFVKSQMAQE